MAPGVDGAVRVDLVSARRRARKNCDYSGKPKVPYRDQEAAEWGTRRLYAFRPHVPMLYVYLCPGCGRWHTTSKGGSNSIPVPEPEGAREQHATYLREQAKRHRRERRVVDEPAQ